MPITVRLKRRLPILNWTRAELHEILWPQAHSPHIRRHRAHVIADRVTVIAALFAILTPAWIFVDLAVFPLSIWGKLAALRLVSGLGFGLLALVRTGKRSIELAYLLLAGLLVIPPLFFLVAQPILTGLPPDPVTSVFVNAYALLPLIVVAGLSVFPLTVLEVAICGLPVVLLSGLSLYGVERFSPSEAVTLVWFLILVLGIASFSGISQLQYMIRLVNQASHDALTGAFTRRTGQESLELQFRIAARLSTPLAVAFIDVDDFKSVNDQFGHEAGDRLLRQLAIALRGILRQSDMQVRWGGEEFVLILPNTSAEGFGSLLQRLAQSGLGQRPDGKPLTVSIGVAERQSDACSDPDALVQLADERMYAAKKSGKNRCIGPSLAASRTTLLP